MVLVHGVFSGLQLEVAVMKKARSVETNQRDAPLRQRSLWHNTRFHANDTTVRLVRHAERQRL